MRTALAYHLSADERQHELHAALNHFNSLRLQPARINQGWQVDLRDEYPMREEERRFVERERAHVQSVAREAPGESHAFLRWFEELRCRGPGQGDALFAWLADSAGLPEMRWFLTQEAAGHAHFHEHRAYGAASPR